ncbi:MAG: aminoacyl-tRNA hydrolase [Acidimicrobiaceae bacterium]|nr:aminoacyl-tRNA hydrolase [Acidimicrobiaceae bacterium]
MTSCLRPAPGVVIPLDELAWRYSTPGGPGGQHANTSHTAAVVRFDVAGSPSLPEWARDRLLTRLGAAVEAGAGERRSQSRNRELAMGRLEARLAAALTPDRPRRPTRPTLASKRRRVEAKRRRGERKQERGRPRFEE